MAARPIRTYRWDVPTRGGPALRRTSDAARSPVYRITGARRSLNEDVAARQRRYLFSMAVRTVCFVLAIFTTGWLRWAFLSGAVLLPYFAVVVANGGRQPEREPMTRALYDPRHVLDPPKPADQSAPPSGLPPQDTPRAS
jgi:hypothetical protein